MSTPHIAAEKGEIAERILLPGDPLRAKFIAENFLDNAKEYTSIHESGSCRLADARDTESRQKTLRFVLLCLFDGCKKLIRVGTCGAMHKDVKLRDVLIAQAASTDSSLIRNIFNNINFCPIADYSLLEKAVASARKLNLPVKVGNVISVDRFYDKDIDNPRLTKYGILGVEMEAAGLYTLAAEAHVRALALFTVSDHLLTGEGCTAEERQTSFQDMMKIALETIIED